MPIKQFIEEFNKLCECRSSKVDVVVAGKGRSCDQINQVIELLKRETSSRIWWGENYISELFSKISLIEAPPTFIGRCQRNMLAKFVKYKIFIQTVQSRSQLSELSNLSFKFGNIECLLQINLDKDLRKAGLLKEEIDDILTFSYEGVKLKGLFYIGYENSSLQERRRAFRYLRESYPDFFLSMGMSEDWKVAIEEGSNMIRLGRVLFEN